MAEDIRPVPDNPETDEPEVIATPEGDNEFNPAEPLRPLPDGSLEDPRGNEPSSYDRDHK